MGAKRDLGEPTVLVRYAKATPEEIRKNRRVLEETVSDIISRQEGRPVKIKLHFGPKPEHYGETRIRKGDSVVYPDGKDPKDLPDWAQKSLQLWGVDPAIPQTAK